MQQIIDSLFPLILTHALVLTLIGAKAAFVTHGMSRWDLFVWVGITTIAAGYFASSPQMIALDTAFNVAAAAAFLHYLVCPPRPMIVILSIFLGLTLLAYAVIHCLLCI